MTVSAEVLLMLAIIGLYLYDSALLLYCNEGILIPKGKLDWIIGFGSDNWRVYGKELFIPNPFQIHRPLFKLSWKFEGTTVTENWDPPRSAFSTLIPMVWSMTVALLVFLPLGLFTSLGDRILILALIVLFGDIFFALIWIWLNRATFHLSNKQFAGLAFESLICPPFALNLVRHLSLNIPIDDDLVSVARRLQERTSWNRTRAQLLARMDDEIGSEEPESERYKILQERRQTFAAEGEECLE